MSDEREGTINDLDLPEDEAAAVEGGFFKSVGGLKLDADVVDYTKEPTSLEIPNQALGRALRGAPQAVRPERPRPGQHRCG